MPTADLTQISGGKWLNDLSVFGVQAVPRNVLQLIAVACIMIAGKDLEVGIDALYHILRCPLVFVWHSFLFVSPLTMSNRQCSAAAPSSHLAWLAAQDPSLACMSFTSA